MVQKYQGQRRILLIDHPKAGLLLLPILSCGSELPSLKDSFANSFCLSSTVPDHRCRFAQGLACLVKGHFHQSRKQQFAQPNGAVRSSCQQVEWSQPRH